MTAIATTTPAATATATGSVRTLRAASVAAATVANAAFFLAAKAGGVEFTMLDANKGEMVPFNVAQIAVVTFVISLLGWAALAAFERFTTHARRNWIVLASAVLVVSFVPFGFVEAATDTKVALGVVHVIVAAALAPMVRRGR